MVKENGISEKFIKYKKLFNIIWYINLFSGLIAILAMVVLIVLHHSNIISLQSMVSGLAINYAGIGISLKGVYLSPYILSYIVINGSLVWVFLVIILYRFKKIYNVTILKGTPFVTDNVANIRKIAYYFIAFSIISFLIQACISYLYLDQIAINNSNIEIYTKISLPLWPILCGVIVVGLSEIFNIGLKIQQDNDTIV